MVSGTLSIITHTQVKQSLGNIAMVFFGSQTVICSHIAAAVSDLGQMDMDKITQASKRHQGEDII